MSPRPIRRHAALRGLAVLIPVTVAAPALGQVPGNVSTAQTLFDEAKALVKKGDYAAACPKFVESHRLDPAGGTVLHAADCHESEGKLATAWTEYHEALSFAIRDRRKDREKIARDQIAALEPRLGKLKIEVPAEVRAIDGLAIRVDGALLDRAGWETPVPLDRGSHTVSLSAPGHKTVEATATVEDGAVATLSLSAPEAEPVVVEAHEPKPAPSEDRGRTQRSIGLVVGAAGALGVAVGSVFGIFAASIGDQSEKCTLGPAQRGCPQSAVDEQDRARTWAAVSTVGFSVGAALLATGAVLYFTAPKKNVSVGTLPGGLVVKGAF